jgi:hypothetical protein
MSIKEYGSGQKACRNNENCSCEIDTALDLYLSPKAVKGKRAGIVPGSLGRYKESRRTWKNERLLVSFQVCRTKDAARVHILYIDRE